MRIAGADLNGSDLTLAANWTEDGSGLITETPIERSPLAAGIHRIHVSLNGQQYNDEMYLDTSVSLHCKTFFNDVSRIEDDIAVYKTSKRMLTLTKYLGGNR